MPKVLVLNDSGHDLSDLKRFGELVILTTGVLPKFQITRMFRNFIPFIADTKSDDYVVAIGPSVMFAIFCCMFAVKHKCINLLLMHESKYIERTLVFNSLEA